MIEEVVLIDVGATVVQAKLALPDNPDGYLIVFHKAGGARHDKSVKKIERAILPTIGSLVPDMTDESEGSLQIMDDEFLLSRARAIIEWFVQKSGAKLISLYALEPSDEFVNVAITHPNVEMIYAQRDGELWLKNKNEQLKIAKNCQKFLQTH